MTGAENREPRDADGRSVTVAPEANAMPGGSKAMSLAHRFLEVRREELAAGQRRAQVQERALDLAQAQEDHSLQIAQGHQGLLVAAQSHAFKVTWVVLIFFGAVMLAILLMAFFGSEEQRGVAVALGRDGVLLAAGYGLITGAARLLRRSTGSP